MKRKYKLAIGVFIVLALIGTVVGVVLWLRSTGGGSGGQGPLTITNITPVISEEGANQASISGQFSVQTPTPQITNAGTQVDIFCLYGPPFMAGKKIGSQQVFDSQLIGNTGTFVILVIGGQKDIPWLPGYYLFNVVASRFDGNNTYGQVSQQVPLTYGN